MRKSAYLLAIVAFCFPLLGGTWARGADAERRSSSADHAADAIGRQIKYFTLADFRGKKYSLDDFAGKAVVVAFLGNECPLCKQYAPRLEELQKEFADRGVAFVGINANQQDTPTEMAAFARVGEITFPLLKDPGNTVADQFAALRTPEVFLLDKNHVIRYRGRIDDQFGLGTGSGYAKPRVKSRDLAVAIDELLSGKALSQSVSTAQGCMIGRVAKVEPHGDVTYANQISRLLQNRCVECHRPGEVAPFALLDYDEVKGWADTMLEVIDEGRMPPWFANPEHGHFVNDARLSDDEKKLFHDWVKNGCPQGDDKDLPPPREFATGWQMGEPDQIVYMRDEPFDVPAEGTVSYQYFAVDPHLTEDKWVQAVEARPGNRAVVHHIIAFVQAPARGRGRGGDVRGGGGLVGYAPGDRARIYPPGVAAFLPAGSKIVFQMHYTPNGTAQQDRSYIGLRYADPATVKRQTRGGAAGNRWFTIPPGEDNHEVISQHKFGKDALLATLFPHMHLRGKSFRYVAHYPDGSQEILLDVPRYDFNWQLRYVLAEPKLMPKGTRLECIAHFDNSEGNLANPNPRDTVRWGDQTWEEMMLGFFSTLPISDDVTGGKPSMQEPASKDEASADTGDGG
jgi:peroxiredoxin